MQHKKGLVIANESEMIFFGSLLAKASGGRGIVFLHGDLGAGKTTFCRGVLHAFDHQGAVKSPTYTLVEPYTIGQNSIYHFDLYRLADPEEIEFIGGRDYFEQNGLFLIEWPSKGQGVLPNADIEITLTYTLAGREAAVIAGSEFGKQLITAIETGFIRHQEEKCRG